MCGIFSILLKEEEDSKKVIEGLKNLQHRGRDCFGVSYLNEKIKLVNKEGLVTDLEIKEKSKSWVGHTRYSTSEDGTDFVQPVLSKISEIEEFTISHNGNIPEKVWNGLERNYKNLYFKENVSDTYKLKFFIEFLSENYSFLQVLKKIIDEIQGTYSLVIHTKNGLYLLRDRYGVKPLEIYNVENGLVVSSESFSTVSERVVPFVEPGSIYFVDYKTMGVSPLYKIKREKISYCSFEYIYFLKGDREINGINVKKFRETLSEKLKNQCFEEFLNLDKSEILVSGVPSSGNIYGKSFAEKMGFTYSQFLNKRKDYPYRTFILPTDESRINACQKKYIITEDIKDKIIFLIDDSIVRGNTMKFLISYLKGFLPREIHLLIASPPVKSPCFYGVDFPDIEELIINKMSKEELKKELEVDSLIYLEIDKLKEISSNMCTSCFTGSYLF